METLIFDWWWRSLSHANVYVFSDCVMPWKDEREPTIKYWLGNKLRWFKSLSQYRALDTLDGEPMEFEWNIFPGFTTLQLYNKVQEFLSKMGEEPEEFTGRNISSRRCSTTSHGDLKTMNRNANKALSSFLFVREDFHQEDGHSSDLDQRKSGTLSVKTVHKENGTESLNWC